MLRLATMSETVEAAALLAELEAAGIHAVVTHEHSPTTLYFGSAMTSIVWVGDASDLDRASEVLRRFESSRPGPRCDCGYSLRGHRGETRCPECGRRMLVEPRSSDGSPRTCAVCGETSPPTFEICWNCGDALDESAGA